MQFSHSSIVSHICRDLSQCSFTVGCPVHPISFTHLFVVSSIYKFCFVDRDPDSFCCAALLRRSGIIKLMLFFDSCAYRPEMSVLHGLVKLLFASLLLCASKFVESGDLYRMRMEKGVNIVTFCTYSAISYILK